MCQGRTPCFAMPSPEGHPRSRQLETAARSLVGVRFRPQGRDRAGCDCLGLVLQAAWQAGLTIDVPPLPLRGLGAREGIVLLRALGCRPIDAAGMGDVLFGTPATLQLHLAMRVEGGLVEAHAGLRRVVTRPLYAGEQWHSAWRLPEGDG